MNGRLEPGDSIAAILSNERPQLEKIFRAEHYSIDEVDRDIVIVRSAAFDLKFAFDRLRMRDVASYIVLRSVPEELPYQPLDVWLRFLGQQPAPLARDRRGIVCVPPEEQIRGDLKLIVHLAAEVFAEPQRARDAAYFVRGYHVAYNDWASRSGHWSED